MSKARRKSSRLRNESRARRYHKQTPATRQRLNPETAETEYLPNRAWRQMIVAKAKKRTAMSVTQEQARIRRKRLVEARRALHDMRRETRRRMRELGGKV